MHDTVYSRYTLFFFFFYENHFYKNVEAEINQNFKNVLRTSLRLRVDLERFYFINLYKKIKVTLM